MREKRALGQCGRTRSIEQKSNIIPLAFVDAIFEKVGVFLVQFAPQFHHFFKTDQHVLPVIAHPFRVVPDNLLHFGAFINDGQCLIHLFLALAYQEFGV